MSRPRLAIIGNGMAAGRLLDDLARRGGLERFDVAVFGEEPHGAYNRILLNRVLDGGEVDEITLKTAAWYAEKGVRLFAGREVGRLDHAARRLRTVDGLEHRFEAAVFATGSVPRVPKVDGLRGPGGAMKAGVFAYRTVADVQRMRSHARPGMRAVVIGGGLLGLEAAKGLADLGLRVTVVHRGPTLMNRQVDRIGGEFLRSSVERLGIAIRTGVDTRAVLGEARAEGLEVGDGERLEAEMVVFASGIRPRVDLARASDVPTNEGILVDDRLETRLPGIFAVGECAEHDGTVHGTVQPIYEQCAVLADVLTGANPGARYRGSKVYTKLKVAGIEVASMGAIEPEGPDDEVIQVIEERRKVYRRLIVREGRLAGAVLVGDSTAAPGLVRLLDTGVELPGNRLDVLASGEASPSAGGDLEICNCHHVNASTLIAEIRDGCDTLARLSEKTAAGTGCGSCRGRLADLILKNVPVATGH